MHCFIWAETILLDYEKKKGGIRMSFKNPDKLKKKNNKQGKNANLQTAKKVVRKSKKK